MGANFPMKESDNDSLNRESSDRIRTTLNSLVTALDLIRPAMLRPIRLSQPYAWAEHIPFSYWIVAKHQPEVIVELGSHSGNSYLSFCQAVSALGLSTRCFAIDTWKGDEHAGWYGEEIYKALAEYHDAHYSAFSRLVRATFDDALPYFSDHSIDLLHIDGLHLYDAVKHDFESWIDKVSDRGIILMHDTNVRENNFGVFRVWEEVRNSFPHFEFLHGHGLGVLGVGSSVGPQIKELFAARLEMNSCNRVRETFAQFGRALLLQQELKDEKRKHQDDASIHERLTTHYDAMAARAKELENELHSERVSHQEQFRLLTTHHDAMAARAKELENELHSDRTSHQEQFRRLTTQFNSIVTRSKELENTLQSARLETEASRASLDILRNQKSISAHRLRGRAKAALAAVIGMAWTQASRGGLRRGVFRAVSRTVKLAAPKIHRRLRRAISDPMVLFDKQWYEARYPEVLLTGVNPYKHYVSFGASHGYDPNPLFDSDWYLAQIRTLPQQAITL